MNKAKRSNRNHRTQEINDAVWRLTAAQLNKVENSPDRIIDADDD